MSKLSHFLRDHHSTVEFMVTEAEAVVNSGATGAHTDQARKNWFLASALLAIFDHLISHDDIDEAEPAPAPAVEPAV